MFELRTFKYDGLFLDLPRRLSNLRRQNQNRSSEKHLHQKKIEKKAMTEAVKNERT